MERGCSVLNENNPFAEDSGFRHFKLAELTGELLAGTEIQAVAFDVGSCQVFRFLDAFALQGDPECAEIAQADDVPVEKEKGKRLGKGFEHGHRVGAAQRGALGHLLGDFTNVELVFVNRAGIKFCRVGRFPRIDPGNGLVIDRHGFKGLSLTFCETILLSRE
jgi:hypothetical protein